MVETVTFTRYERGVQISENEFTFTVPTGTIRDPGPAMGDRVPPAVGGVYPLGAALRRPELKSKVEPVYSAAALRAGFSGMALVTFEVDAKGQTRNAVVERPIGFGLDEGAVQAVLRWQFDPGVAVNGPVSVGPITAAVNFR